MLAPRANPGLMGHAAAEQSLVRATREGRLHHGWLLAGPRGIGKATLAFRFARWLLAGAPASLDDTLELPEDHPVFRHVMAGSHPDLHLLTIERGQSESTGRRRTEIEVDDVRAMGAFLHLTPALSPWRVVIIDAADEMNMNAATATLKLLEEPPNQAILLLVSHAPTRLLPTLRSRCRRLNLRPLSPEDIGRFIATRLPEADNAKVLVDLAEGSPGQALRLAEEGAPELLGAIEAFVRGRGERGAPGIHDLAESLSRAGADDPTGLGFRLVQQVLEHRVRTLTAARGPGRGDGWVTAWERVAQLARQTDGLRLDRKHAMLAALTTLFEAWNAA